MATPTLAEVLTTHKLRDAFLKFAEAQHAEENFLFYLDVEAYRRLTSPNELVHHSRLIVEVLFLSLADACIPSFSFSFSLSLTHPPIQKYLMVGSTYELCAPNALKSQILDHLGHPTPTLFDELGDVIYNWTLTEMHHKFLTSNQYYAAIGAWGRGREREGWGWV